MTLIQWTMTSAIHRVEKKGFVMNEDILKAARSESSATVENEVSDHDIDAYEKNHPILATMTDEEKKVWYHLDDIDRKMMMSDRAYYGQTSQEVVTFHDVIGIRHFDGLA